MLKLHHRKNKNKSQSFKVKCVSNCPFYFQETAPEYDVSRITTPVALFWSKNDNFVDTKDVKTLEMKLKSVVFSYCVPDPLFTHMDYVLGIGAHNLVYDKVLSLLNEY